MGGEDVVGEVKGVEVLASTKKKKL
jgi:hypothetical protein